MVGSPKTASATHISNLSPVGVAAGGCPYPCLRRFAFVYVWCGKFGCTELDRDGVLETWLEPLAVKRGWGHHHSGDHYVRRIF